jgi:hypothetical protein
MFKEDTEMIRMKLFGTLVVAVGALAVAGNAFAVPSGTITFDDVFGGGGGSQTGIIGWDADTGTIHGIDIVFTIVTGTGGTLHDGVDDLCDACLLNFAVSGTDLGGFDYEVNPGGATNTAVLIGAVPVAGAGPGTLLAGSFLEGDIASGAGAFRFGSAGVDEKDPNLVLYYWGVPVDEFTFVFNAQAVPQNRVTGSLPLPGGIHGVGDLEVWWPVLTEVDLSNSPSVPEPGTAYAVLLGLGLLAAYRRRKN